MVGPKAVEAMKAAIARPRTTGSAKMSANKPPVTTMGAEAQIPARKRKVLRAA